MHSADNRSRASRRHFHELVDTVAVLMAVSEEDGRYSYFNQTWLTFTGRTLEQQQGAGWIESLHADDRARCLELQGEAIGNQGSYELDFRMRRHDGEYRWVLSRGTPRFSLEGRFLGYVQSCTDITEHKYSEEESRQSRQCMERALAELASHQHALDQHAIVAVTDVRGMILHANDKFCQISQYSRQELIGQNHRIVKSAVHPPSFFVAMWRTISRGETWHGEICNRAKDGSLYWVDTTIVPLKDATGRIVQYISLRTDITASKQAAETLEMSLRAAALGKVQLERQAAELAHKNAQLADTGERAEAATRAKSEFLANMSHEIRTPMTAILGFTDLLIGDVAGGSPSERLNALQTIKRNGEFLLEIINDILDLSKIEAGRVQMEVLRCSPAKVLEDVRALMEIRAEAKGLSITLEYATPLPEAIRTDPTRWRQILINLVGNAIKFTETGGVRMVASFERPEGGSPRLACDVIDSGIGMSEPQRARLFRPFTQADSSTTRKFGGTGLGLTISQRLANMLGGDITVRSVYGEGSTFRIEIDAGAAETSTMIAGPQPAQAIETPPERTNAATADRLDCRILLAEDGPDNQRLLSFVLKKAGARVTVVENGALAVEACLGEAAAGRPYDVVLMDMQMPVMDGYDATRTLRQRGYRGPIIALTAHAMSGDEEKCRAAGCSGYASKPIDRPRLLAAIQQSLARPVATSPRRP